MLEKKRSLTKRKRKKDQVEMGAAWSETSADLI